MRQQEATVHNSWDVFNWPVVICSVSLWPWLDTLLSHMPAPTVIYMAISATFMLFQMLDKLGLLERLKRRPPRTPPRDY